MLRLMAGLLVTVAVALAPVAGCACPAPAQAASHQGHDAGAMSHAKHNAPSPCSDHDGLMSGTLCKLLCASAVLMASAAAVTPADEIALVRTILPDIREGLDVRPPAPPPRA